MVVNYAFYFRLCTLWYYGMVEISWKTSEDHIDDATGLPPLMETPIGPMGMGS